MSGGADRICGVVGRALVVLGVVSFLVHIIAGIVVIVTQRKGWDDPMPHWIWVWMYASIAVGFVGVLLAWFRPAGPVRGIAHWVRGGQS